MCRAQEAAVSSTCRYDTILVLPSVRQSPIVVAMGRFDSSFDLNLVNAFAGGVQGFLALRRLPFRRLVGVTVFCFFLVCAKAL